jgi:anti-sigma factor RsiW
MTVLNLGFLAPKPLPCQELVELCTAYLDGSLPRRDRRRFEAHVAGCDHCTAYLEQFRLTIEATGTLTEEQIDPDAREELLEVFRDWSAAR